MSRACRLLRGFRSLMNIARHGFGRGNIRSFSYPLPPLLRELGHRSTLASRPANRCMSGWQGDPLPAEHAAFIERCIRPELAHAAAAEYGPAITTPAPRPRRARLSTAARGSPRSLAKPSRRRVVLTTAPRMPTRVAVAPLQKGDAGSCGQLPPVAGVRGDYQVKMRHGVSRLRAGQRHTLGVIFHDAAQGTLQRSFPLGCVDT